MNPATIRVGDLTVNRLGFGAMRVCGRQIWGPPADPENARLVLRRAYALGHNFLFAITPPAQLDDATVRPMLGEPDQTRRRYRNAD